MARANASVSRTRIGSRRSACTSQMILPRSHEARMRGYGRPVPAAVIFDLDGLLLESEQVWNASKRRLTDELGGRWRAEAERAMLGMSSPEWSRYMHEELEVPLPPQDISTEVVRLLRESYERELPLLPGADEAVRGAAERWPLGLASSSNREVIDTVLARTGWDRLFAVSVSSE